MISTDGIILKSYPILEKDTIVECFTKNYGRINLFIKFNQSKKPRFGGLTTSLNNVMIDAIEKKDTYYLKSVKLNLSYSGIKKDIKKMALAYHFLDVAISVTERNQENQEMFSILVDFMMVLDQCQQDILDQLKTEFQQAVLVTEGISSTNELLKYNEKKWSKMIEYYSNKELKELT